MRNVIHAVIKSYLCEQFKSVREENEWSKKTMAEKLSMDPRSYANLESGESACGSVTFVAFLFVVLPPERRAAMLDGLCERILKVLADVA
ncbi:MAG: helix-turn-helix transcriptional regulator [Clostridia bacterium]|nr:helix-turn-helix transcriptional regulator [Clostridia bacterium]